jgi:hypothetical protein
MTADSTIGDCVRDWHDAKLTQLEVLDVLHSLPTLELQLELLSKLTPDITELAKRSVSNLPADVDGYKHWHVGAGIPRTTGNLELTSEDRARIRASREDEHRRKVRLHDYFVNQDKHSTLP